MVVWLLIIYPHVRHESLRSSIKLPDRKVERTLAKASCIQIDEGYAGNSMMVLFCTLMHFISCIQDTLSSRARLALQLHRPSASREQRYLAYNFISCSCMRYTSNRARE